MSDTATNTTDALLRRISELEKRLTKVNGESKNRKETIREQETAIEQLKAQLQAVGTELSQVKQSPSDWQAKHDELRKQLNARDAADAWKGVVGPEALASKVTLEKLWAEIGYTPGEGVPTPEEIGELVKQARETVPYLFATEPAETAKSTRDGSQSQQSQVKPPLRESIGVSGRGAPATAESRVLIQRSKYSDPSYGLDANARKQRVEARRTNTHEVVD